MGPAPAPRRPDSTTPCPLPTPVAVRPAWPSAATMGPPAPSPPPPPPPFVRQGDGDQQLLRQRMCTPDWRAPRLGSASLVPGPAAAPGRRSRLTSCAPRRAPPGRPSPGSPPAVTVAEAGSERGAQARLASCGLRPSINLPPSAHPLQARATACQRARARGRESGGRRDVHAGAQAEVDATWIATEGKATPHRGPGCHRRCTRHLGATRISRTHPPRRRCRPDRHVWVGWLVGLGLGPVRPCHG
eukprot:scaffold1281_cov265-Prasinococcus_capsulatus_cf.AAC.4